MSRQILAVAFLGTLVAVTACDTPTSIAAPAAMTVALKSAQAPADGNGNKQVFTIDVGPDPITCPNGEVISRHITGWVQVRFFDQGGSRNVELDVFHQNFTFTNADGKSWTWYDVGPDRVWLEDGDLMVAVTGRAAGANIGRFVINLTTGEVVFQAGKDVAAPRVYACENLT
jgi:hypothetical protein